MANSKKKSFSKSTIFKKFLRKFQRMDFGLGVVQKLRGQDEVGRW